ncbi:ribonuclease III [Patescibacteria group bacterium]|nr:ribonuclease III [Patescibacteria group bacterium]
MSKELSEFEKSTGITFNNKQLLMQAFVHRSYLNEHRDFDIEHNERLEFLGDAVLELIVTDYLFNTYKNKPEGELTVFRSALVNTNTLSNAAVVLNMNDYLLLSRGEAKDTGRARQYILANTFEAFIGALYLDRGYDAAKGFITKTILPLTDGIVKDRLWQDSKSHFQEKSQEKMGVTPEYKTLKEDGPDHDKRFVVGVFLDAKQIGEGEGKSKQEAEQDAAKAALKEHKW